MVSSDLDTVLCLLVWLWGWTEHLVYLERPRWERLALSVSRLPAWKILSHSYFRRFFLCAFVCFFFFLLFWGLVFISSLSLSPLPFLLSLFPPSPSSYPSSSPLLISFFRFAKTFTCLIVLQPNLNDTVFCQLIGLLCSKSRRWQSNLKISLNVLADAVFWTISTQLFKSVERKKVFALFKVSHSVVETVKIWLRLYVWQGVAKLLIIFQRILPWW